MVVTIAEQFAKLHNALKFEALYFLSAFLSSEYSIPVRDSLRLMKNNIWATNIRIGVVAILQNRVPPAEKLHALILAEYGISIVGEQWLFGPMNYLPDLENLIPADRCILLVLECSVVETAVLLNDLAYLKYEASKDSSNVETILLKQRNLCVAISLVEKIIKLIASVAEDEGGIISEVTLIKIISGLNETIGVTLEYLQDAKAHGQRKGDNLLASVGMIGRYLAEMPIACKENVVEILDYMLLIEGDNEPTPFYSICFLLRMLCQIALEIDGCKVIALSGSYKFVVECLIKLIDQLTAGDFKVEDTDQLIFLACDTLMNPLLKREEIRVPLDDFYFVKLLGTLLYWTDSTGGYSVVMMASSICALILDFTSEKTLQQHPDFDSGKLISLSHLISKGLSGQDATYEDAKTEADLYEIVLSGYSRWAERFPHIKEAVGK